MPQRVGLGKSFISQVLKEFSSPLDGLGLDGEVDPQLKEGSAFEQERSHFPPYVTCRPGSIRIGARWHRPSHLISGRRG